MEPRNPYAEKLKDFPRISYANQDAERFRGQWRKQFLDAASHPGSRRPIHVEIGCNGGHVILEWATRKPSDCYVGLDWKYKQIYLGAEKAHERGLKNLMLVRGFAERLRFMFEPGEIDHLYLFFPDPWPKRAQQKNRSINAQSLRAFAELVGPNGTFEIKTDHAGYFEWMEKAVSEVTDIWSVAERSTDLHASHPNPALLQIPDVTLFERLFIKDGIKINRMLLKKK